MTDHLTTVGTKLQSLLRRGFPTAEVTRERPEMPSERATVVLKPETHPQATLLEEYAALSRSLGIANPHIDADLKVEQFKAFLRAKDWAIFALPTVIAYMDKKAAAESAHKSGWHWRPLRAKDNIKNVSFGTAARATEDTRRPASDHYVGEHTEQQRQWGGGGTKAVDVPASGAVYDKLVPIHALRKVAEIEKSFPKPVSFFVCDYAPAPHIEYPDPFLMAVINNARLDQGVGRFIIDFWDEPGFGLEQMLK